MFVFSHKFSILWKFTYPMLWELYGFLFYAKYLRNPSLLNVSSFPYFIFTMWIPFPHVFGIVWIKRKNLSKSISGKDMSIPSYLPLNKKKNSQNSSKTHGLGTIWFSTGYFHVMWTCTFPDIAGCISFHHF